MKPSGSALHTETDKNGPKHPDFFRIIAEKSVSLQKDIKT
jgi:hypothetical protein